MNAKAGQASRVIIDKRQAADTPLFSIVTINLNNASGLRLTVESVLGQLFEGYELIVIDGGSDDGSREYLLEMLQAIAVVVSERDGGIYSAMNKGYEFARGEYIVFLNSGDYFSHSGVLNRVAKELDCGSFRPDFLYGDSFEVREDGGGLLFKKAKSHTLCWYGMFTQHQAMFFARKRMVRLGMQFDECYTIAADWDMVSRFLRNTGGGAVVKRIDAPLAVFGCRGASRNYKKAIAEQYAIRRKNQRQGFVPCALLAGWHYIVNRLRTFCPALYYAFNRLRAAWYRYRANGTGK